MTKKLIIFCLIWLSVQPIFAQSSSGKLGSGLSFQLGLNPKSDYMTWSAENSDFAIFPKHRLSFGASAQINPYEKLQFEASVLYTKSHYINPYKNLISSSRIEVTDWEFPIGVRYNLPSPVSFHSSIVYRTGIVLKNRIIPLKNELGADINFFIPSVYAGLRLATETKWYGHFEYGVDYVRNFNSGYGFQLPQEDAPPVHVDINQRVGQFNFVFVYYFTPRVFNWSKSRYSMDDIAN